MKLSQGSFSDFLDMNVEIRGRLLYYYNDQGIYSLDLDEVPNENPVRIADANLHFNTPYLKDGNELVSMTQDGTIMILDENDHIDYILPNLAHFHKHENFLLGPKGQLHLYVNSRRVSGGFQSYDQGDTWIDVGLRWPDEYEVDLELESYPSCSLIQINGDTTACVRIRPSCDPSILKPQAPYDAVVEMFVGSQFHYTTDKGQTWELNYSNFIGEPNTSMIVVDGLLHIYSPVQSMPEFPVRPIFGENIEPTWNIYDPKSNFDLINEVSLIDYPLGETNGSFRVNQSGELHQHPLLTDDYSYIDDRQLSMSPAGELHLVPDSDASYVINRSEEEFRIYYRENREGDYHKLFLSPISLPQGELHVAADQIYFETEEDIFRADHPDFSAINTVIEIAICEGESHEGYSNAGTHVDVFTSVDGRDSTRTIHLEILPAPTKTLDITICEGDEYEGYDSSGTYLDNFVTADGCDSTRTLHLDILPTSQSELNQTICAGEFFEGYATTGTYQDLYTGANGCDSIRTLYLEVTPAMESYEAVHLCIGESYGVFSKAGLHQERFVNLEGCDSLHTVEIFEIERGDPICAFEFDEDPMQFSETTFLNIYPNPSTSEVTLYIDKTSRLPSDLFIISMDRNLVQKKTITQSATDIDINDLPVGIYFFYLQNGNNVYVDRVVKM